MSEVFNFLGLPLELRRLVYRELLLIDHRSGNWEWSLESLGAFNQRHAVTRANSLIRHEAQETLIGNIPWRLCINLYSYEEQDIRSRNRIQKILSQLSARQSSLIRELVLVYVIDEADRDRPIKHCLQAPLLPEEFCTFMVEHLSAVQRLSITWLDSAPALKSEKTKALLEPLAGLQHVSSIIIRKGTYPRSGFPENGGELAKCINDIVSGASIELQ